MPGIPGLFHEAFFRLNSIKRLYNKRRNCLGQNNWPEKGFLLHRTPEEHPNVLDTGPSSSVNPIPVKLHCQVISILHCTYHACSFTLRMQAVMVKMKICRSTKQVTLVCCICTFHQLHYFVFLESSNIHFSCLSTQKRALIIN